MAKVITIAREFGSGGREIAQRVAEKLQIMYYDNQILDLAAEELGLDIRAVRQASREKSSGFLYAGIGGTGFQMPLPDQVFAIQSKIIRHLALHDDCIIVNGVADYVLEDYDQVLRVFIHAPFESRVERAKTYEDVEGDVVKYVKKQDKRRSNYYNYYTTNKWGQLKNFDLTINSDLGIEEAADIIATLYQKL